MQRTERGAPTPSIDLMALVRVIGLLDAALQRGIVISVSEAGMEVDDDQVAEALKRVNSLMNETNSQLNKMALIVNTAQKVPPNERPI